MLVHDRPKIRPIDAKNVSEFRLWRNKIKHFRKCRDIRHPCWVSACDQVAGPGSRIRKCRRLSLTGHAMATPCRAAPIRRLHSLPLIIYYISCLGSAPCLRISGCCVTAVATVLAANSSPHRHNLYHDMTWRSSRYGPWLWMEDVHVVHCDHATEQRMGYPWLW